jgi:hypothetical protein
MAVSPAAVSSFAQPRKALFILSIDILVGGAGNDTLTGAGGRDIFDYGFKNAGNDTITDFTLGNTTTNTAVWCVFFGGFVRCFGFFFPFFPPSAKKTAITVTNNTPVIGVY